jgi:hypothetical protein
MIEGEFDRSVSYRTEDGKLVVKFLNEHIIDYDVQAVEQNPVRYI